jgi:hypothetical protein
LEFLVPSYVASGCGSVAAPEADGAPIPLFRIMARARDDRPKLRIDLVPAAL